MVCSLLHQCWSPRQIAHALKCQHPQQIKLHACPETIYRAIYAYPRGELKRELIALLGQGRSCRKPCTRGKDRRGKIAGMLSVHVRPPEVDERVVPGHWEADLIKGNRSAVGVLVERSSRLVLLCKMADASARSALKAFTAKLNQIAQPMRSVADV